MTVARNHPVKSGSGSIDEILARKLVRTVFQPVVHLQSRSVAGFEALTRGPAGSALEPPLALLAAAKDSGRLGELDWLCRANAMRTAVESGLPDTLSWFVNTEPAGLAMECPPHLVPTLQRAREELRLVLEVVEREMQDSVLELIYATDQARRDVWGVALDDVGADEGSLALLPLLRPDVVKLDMALVQHAPGATAAAVTAAVRSYAEQSGAIILAEGIETVEHERLARTFGATYGQGYRFGRPGPLPATLTGAIHSIPLRQHLDPLDGRTPFDVLSDKLTPQRGRKADLLHISAHLERQAAIAPHASVLLAGFQRNDYFSAAKGELYRRLSAHNALTIVLADGLTRHEEPTFHIGALRPESRLSAEWVVIVIDPHYAAAFVARDCGDSGPDAEREFDFIYTHDREKVVDAARSFVQDLRTGDERRQGGPQVAGADSAYIATLACADPGAPVGPVVSTVQTVGGTPAPSPLEAPLGFQAASKVVLNYLNTYIPMAFWSVTRVENDRQTYLYLDDNAYGLTAGGSHPWQDSYCIHMVAGTAPQVAPDAAAVPLYAAAEVNKSVQIGAYAGAPIAEPNGSVFGAICGLDRNVRPDLVAFEPILTLLSELLAVALASDRALQAAENVSQTALTYATTDDLTGIRNRRAWNDRITQLDQAFVTFADPTVIVVIDLDDLKQVNDGPGGHAAGDDLLRLAAQTLRYNLRDHDFLARLGGDEFGIILTGTPAEQAPKLAARLGRALDRVNVPASVGWSSLRPDSTTQRAIELADHAMYAAKANRRLARLHSV